MYATEECAKALLHLQQFIPGLNLSQELMPSSSTPVFNDNTGDDIVFWAPCPCCCHIQIQEYVVRESVMNGFVNVTHIAGHVNLADIFTKEDKDEAHFYYTSRYSILLLSLSLSPFDDFFCLFVISNACQVGNQS